MEDNVQDRVRAAWDDETTTPDSGAPDHVADSIRSNAPLSFDKLDDDLFAAILHGDETHVRARLGSSDRPLSEAEAVILIRTRQHEEEIGYERMVEQALATAAKEDKETAAYIWYVPEVHHAHYVPRLDELDAYGGHYDRKEARYYDRFGGSYDATGYRHADGSYQTAAGDYYHAGTRRVQLAIGGSAEILPAELADAGIDVMRLALQVAELRSRARANHQALAALADDAPQAFAAAMDTLQADTRKHFEQLAMDDAFKAAANDVEGGGLKYMSCPLLTRKDLRMAANIVSDNLACGRHPHEMAQYHYRNILDMKDDAEDALVAALQPPFDHVQLPGLSDKANDAFARFKSPDTGFSLKDKADSVFGKPEAEVPPEIIVGAQNRYRNALRRPNFALA